MKKEFFIHAVTLLFISMLLFAAASKWLDFQQYRYEINSQPFSNVLTPYIIWTVPLIQFIAAVLLMFARTRKIGFVLAISIVIIFAAYASAVLVHAFDYIPCECGGIIKGMSWPQNLLFNLLFGAAGIGALILHRRVQNNYQTDKIITGR